MGILRRIYSGRRDIRGRKIMVGSNNQRHRAQPQRSRFLDPRNDFNRPAITREQIRYLNNKIDRMLKDYK